MAEGWAVYATELMDEVGFLTPMERFAHRQTRLRMSARAIVDVSMHNGRLSLSEAAAFYEQRAGMTSQAAHREAVQNSLFPGTAMMYVIAADHIRALRTEMSQQWGQEFSLRRFHDEFLSYGSIPVRLVASHMAGEVPSL